MGSLLTGVLQEAVNPSYLLAWIPETLLNEKGQTEWDKFVKIEERPILDTEEDGVLHCCLCQFRVLKMGNVQTPS